MLGLVSVGASACYAQFNLFSSRMLGQIRDAALKEFNFLIQPHQNLDKRLQNLKVLVRDHFSSPDAEDRQFVENMMKFVGKTSFGVLDHRTFNPHPANPPLGLCDQFLQVKLAYTRPGVHLQGDPPRNN